MLGRHPRVLINAILVSAVGAAGLFLACTDSYRTNAATSTGTGGAGTGGTGTAGDGGGLINDGGVCELTCSNDLKKVINCKGVTIDDCISNGQVCVNSACTDDPPCTAAELAKSSYGCDYWAVKTAQRVEASGACFAVFIANTWPANVHITVEHDGVQYPTSDFTGIPSGQGQSINYAPYDDAVGLAENQVAILFLSQDPNGGLIQCPLTPLAHLDGDGPHGDGQGPGVPHPDGLPGRGLPDRPVRRRSNEFHVGDAAPAHQRVGRQLHDRQCI
jgi:hypothetical protein